MNESIMRAMRPLAVMAAALLASGCAVTAVEYRPSGETQAELRDVRFAPVAVGSFTAPSDVANESLSLRGNPMAALQGSYTRYLEEALKLELDALKALVPKADLTVSGTLLRNRVDILGFNVGEGEIEARFIVARPGNPPLEVVKRVTHTWESSFVGAYAVGRAVEQYPVMVQKLVREFLRDERVRAALSR